MAKGNQAILQKGDHELEYRRTRRKGWLKRIYSAPGEDISNARYVRERWVGRLQANEEIRALRANGWKLVVYNPPQGRRSNPPRFVYHGTSTASARDIAKRGIRMEASTKGYFGEGFYTAEDPALAKSNYADFADEDEGPGVVLKLEVRPGARLLDLRKSSDWDKWGSLKIQGRKATDLMSFDGFAEMMVEAGVDGLYDESFGGWVFYNPKVIKLVGPKVNPARRRRKKNPPRPFSPDEQWAKKQVNHIRGELQGLFDEDMLDEFTAIEHRGVTILVGEPYGEGTILWGAMVGKEVVGGGMFMQRGTEIIEGTQALLPGYLRKGIYRAVIEHLREAYPICNIASDLQQSASMQSFWRKMGAKDAGGEWVLPARENPRIKVSGVPMGVVVRATNKSPEGIFVYRHKSAGGGARVVQRKGNQIKPLSPYYPGMDGLNAWLKSHGIRMKGEWLW